MTDRHMVDMRALWTLGETACHLLDAFTAARVHYVVDHIDDNGTAEVRVTWPADAVFTTDPTTILSALAWGVDTARQFGDSGMYERPWTHLEVTHAVREGNYLVTTFAIVPDDK